MDANKTMTLRLRIDGEPAAAAPAAMPFAARAQGITGSLIDSSIALLQRQTQPVISFAMGSPAADAIPAVAIAAIAATILGDAKAEALNYGPTEGEASLRQALLAFLADCGQPVSSERLMITAGGTQGLDLVAKLFIDPGDIVIAEEPSYTNGTAIITGYQGRILRCPMDDAGMQVEKLPGLIAAADRKPKLVYVIPNSQNPGGTTLSLERRLLLLRLAAKHEFLILEDDPYGLLYFDRPPPASLLSLDGSAGRVIAVNTFSKIISPGLRVGWVVAPPPVIERMIAAKQGLDTCSNPLGQRIIAGFLAGGHMAAHLTNLRDTYRLRRDAMLEALAGEFGSLHGSRWSRPDGGFFVWVELPGNIATDALFALALEEGVAFIPGSAFVSKDGPRNAMRLCFANASPAEIFDGTGRLRRAVDRLL
jgi:2-aminoadipate transaminase